MVVLRQYSLVHGTRHCDQRCYDAKGKRCLCCCGGINHGVGLNQAIKNAPGIVKEAAAENGPEVLELVRFKTLTDQLRLFT